MSTSKSFDSALRRWSDIFMSRSMHHWMHFVRASGLSMPQFSALMRLYYQGACGLSDIGRHLGISSAAASQMVERLVQHGWVERVEAAHDRRAKHISLTLSGRELIEQSMATRHQWLDELPRRLTSQQQATVTAALHALIEAAGQPEAQPRPEKPR